MDYIKSQIETFGAYFILFMSAFGNRWGLGTRSKNLTTYGFKAMSHKKKTQLNLNLVSTDANNDDARGITNALWEHSSRRAKKTSDNVRNHIFMFYRAPLRQDPTQGVSNLYHTHNKDYHYM